MYASHGLLVAFACLLHVLVLREYVPQKTYTTERNTSYTLVIGVLSARSNFDLRNTLRRTWVGHVKKHSTLKQKVLVQFVVSDKACLIPPEYRTDPYRCEENVVEDLVLDKDIISYTMPDTLSESFSFIGPMGRDFSVLYPIVITSLGISANGRSNMTSTVRLYDKNSKEEIVSVQFSPEDPGTFHNGSWFKTVPNYILPKGFQASIVSENFKSASTSCDKKEELIEINDGGGLITAHKIKRFGDESGVFPEKEETIYHENCPHCAATFIYKAHEDVVKSLSSKEERDGRIKEWRELKDAENHQLLREAKFNSDILIVPNVDVYRNIPAQLLAFYQWLSENVSFSFAMKTDDDCFVNIEGILKAIEHHKLNLITKVWWGRFRTDWLIDRQGKWAEPDYPGVTYPTFACGAGNVLSAGLIHWLARNAGALKRYQGEDVSMGIWLSAVGPSILMDNRWSCFKECFRDMFSSPEQDSESLHEMWENLQSCGNPCSC